MKVLFALTLIAACGVVQAKDKLVAHADVAQQPGLTPTEANDGASKAKARAEVPPKLGAGKAEATTRDPYVVPLLRDARSVR